MKSRGFTLVEVLVALVVVAVGMSALLGAIGAAADNTIYLRDKTFAQWVALNRVAEVRLAQKPPSKGKTDGETELAGVRWHWQQEVTDMDVPGAMRVDVKVQPASARNTDEKKNVYLGYAIGVIGDAIGAPLNAASLQSKWESPPVPPGGAPPGGDPQTSPNPQPTPPPTDPPPEPDPGSSE